MALGGFLQGLGIAAGNDILVGQQLDDQRANTQLKQQQSQMNKMSMLAQQQKQSDEKQIGAYIASEAQKDSSLITDPTKMSQTFQKAAALALQNGDFSGAEEMSKLATGKMQEAKEQAVVVQQQQQVKKEALASAAEDYAANPTPEASKELVQKAVAAGVSPTTIPAPGTPAFKAWTTQQQLASKTAAQRADFVQKAYETDQNRLEKQREHADNMADRLEARRQTAAIQQGNLELRREALADRQQLRAAEAQDRAMRAPTTKDVAGATYEWDPTQQKPGTRNLPDAGWVKIGGAKTTATQSAANNAIVASASEAVRGLKIIGAMDSDTTAGPFAGLHDGTILDAFSKTGTNAVTPANMQIYHTVTAGMGLEIARTMTLGAGRGANQATINEMQHIVEGHAGDDNATLLLKYANAADIIRNRLSTLPETDDPKVKKQREEVEATLAKIPDPVQILKAVKDPAKRKQLMSLQSSMSELASKMENEAQTPGGEGVSTNTPPSSSSSPSSGGGALPSGWSVTEHN